MESLGGMFDRIALAMAGKRSPWGGGPRQEDENQGDGERDSGSEGGTPPSAETPRGPRNPWLPGGTGEEPPRRSANIEDIFRKRGPEGPRRRTGGGGGGPNFTLPRSPFGRNWFPLLIAGIAALWLAVTMIHQVGPKEEGIVTTFGKYSRTLQPGLNFTLPWPIQNVDVEPVSTIRSMLIPENGEEKLVLTGDQNLVNLSYIVRWNIKDLKLFKFQLAEPEQTISEVAEAAMRASVAERTLDDTFSGAGRGDIEERVRTRMQAVLDAYRSGISIQGVAIAKTDPPERVVEAFKDVSAAEQDADAEVNRARAFAQQLLAQAQGEATAFDKVYEQYRLAPEVTKRRMYYETMERILSKIDKTIVQEGNVTPYLPLPELKRRAQQAQTPAGGQ